MAKILVTGGAGFIGSHLCDRLVARGDEVIVLDDFSSGHERNLSQLNGKVTVIRDDLLNIAVHQAKLEGVTSIFHLAALISGYDSLLTPDAYVATNITGLLRVLEVAAKLKSPRIVFASSSTVYGNRTEPTCRETDVPAPITLYALSKLAGEHLLAMYQGRYGYSYCALRLFNVYGPRQSPTHPYANVTCKFAHAAATTKQVKLYGDGKQSRDFVFVDDVVAALLAAEKGSAQPVYNVGTGKDASIISLLETVQQVSGATLQIERLPPWSNDIQCIRADASPLARDLKVTAQVNLRDGLGRTVEYFKKLGV